jgi:hypothetical protein
MKGNDWMKEIKKKILPKYFKEVKAGIKDFEIRKDDSDYEVGDILILQEFCMNLEVYPRKECYTGNGITKRIKYKITSEEFPQGIKEGYCILGLEDINKQQFQLGDTAYCIDEDYRFFESIVNRIDLNKGAYFYTTNDADFEPKDIGDWVFTSELYRQIHMQNIAESEDK